jgi:signal transduction histidine kinase
MPSSNDKSSPISFDASFIATMRCILAVFVLLILTLDLLARVRFNELTYLILSLYVAYSALLYGAARWWHPLLPRTVEPWLDVGWSVGLMALSGDSSGIFAAFSFFAILSAAFQWGFAPGFRIALVAAILALSVGIALGPGRPHTGFRHVLIGPASLLVLGYMIASYGGLELGLRRRLTLLKDITRFSNPRLGVDRTIGMIVERLRAFYDADACLLIMPHQCANGSGYELRRADREDPARAAQAEDLPAELTRLLMAWPDHDAVVHGRRRTLWQRWPAKARAEVVDIRRGTRLPADEKLSEALAAMLDAMVFITVPLSSTYVSGGRLYLTAGSRRAFDSSDVDFLLQVIDQTMSILHNIKLVDQLASDAAAAERQRIALDLHDGVIQPYIGLQMGLEAVRRKLVRGHADVTPDIERLLDLTRGEIPQLRHTVQGLKRGGEGVDGLVPALRRFVLKFAAATGIQVQVEIEGELEVSDRLAADVFFIVTEGLSNIRRHTQAAAATIMLAQDNGHLILQIRNDGVQGEEFHPFRPRSITDRATSLGGRVRVERQGHAQTAVIVEIPL